MNDYSLNQRLLIAIGTLGVFINFIPTFMYQTSEAAVIGGLLSLGSVSAVLGQLSGRLWSKRGWYYLENDPVAFFLDSWTRVLAPIVISTILIFR